MNGNSPSFSKIPCGAKQAIIFLLAILLLSLPLVSLLPFWVEMEQGFALVENPDENEDRREAQENEEEREQTKMEEYMLLSGLTYEASINYAFGAWKRKRSEYRIFSMEVWTPPPETAC